MMHTHNRFTQLHITVTSVLVCTIVLLLAGVGMVQRVEASDCRVEAFTQSPVGDVPLGADVHLYGKGSCAGGVRAVKFQISGMGSVRDKAETSLPEQSETWKTSEVGFGQFQVCFLVAGGSNGDWSAGTQQCVTVNVTGAMPVDSNQSGQPTQPPPQQQQSSNNCRVVSFTQSPGSPVVIGAEVYLYGIGTCDAGVRAVKFQVDGQDKAEGRALPLFAVDLEPPAVLLDDAVGNGQPQTTASRALLGGEEGIEDLAHDFS